MKNPLAVIAFGVHLRKLREAKEFSQQKLADLADLSKSTIYRFETGQLVATVDALISIAKALEVAPSELIQFPMPEEKPAKPQKAKK